MAVLLFTLFKALGYLPIAWGIGRLSEKGLRSWIGLGVSRVLLGQCLGWSLYYMMSVDIITDWAPQLFFICSFSSWLFLLCRSGLQFLPSTGALALACTLWSLVLSGSAFLLLIIVFGRGSS